MSKPIFPLLALEIGDLIIGSYEKALNEPFKALALTLGASPGLTPRQLSAWLYYECSAVVLAQDASPEPKFIYANIAAQHLFEFDWMAFRVLEGRQSAELPERAERAELLKRVGQENFVRDYHGVRVTASGRRFSIQDGLVWRMKYLSGEDCGTAALFSGYTWLNNFSA